MKFPKLRANWAALAILFVSSGVSLGGCGQTSGLISSPSLTCSGAYRAFIGVGDGYLLHLCGCNGTGEAAGTVVSSGQILTCHLAQADTQVSFHFGQGAGSPQIVPVGAPTLSATPWVAGGQQVPQVFPVKLGQSSVTYIFQDAMTGVQGQIIVP